MDPMEPTEEPSRSESELKGATEEALSEQAGGPFSPSAQPIGHPAVEEGAETGDSGAAPADEVKETKEAGEAESAPPKNEQPLRIEIGLVEGSLTIIGGAE